MDETTSSANCNGTSGKVPYQNGTSGHHVTSPDVIEKDSRNGGTSADIHYPPSMHDIATRRPVFLLARSPILDNEKDMTRTPTTPRSPPAPITASPASSDSHDGKITPGIGGGSAASTGGVLPRGAHLPSYRSTGSSTVSTTSSSSSSASAEPGNDGGYVGGAGGYRARPQPRTQYATGGHRFSSHNSYGGSGGQGQQGMGGGGGGGGGMPHPLHMQSDPRYRVGSGQYDTRYANRPPVAAAMYNQPAQAYSTYPSESYALPYRTNYSRPLSTGSLSSISTASSRPGFSSLDEFPTMNDHRSTFAPSVGAAGEGSRLRHRNSAGATYGRGGEFHHYHSYPYRQIHDHPSNSGGAYIEASSPMSPPSYDEHQPLLSLSLSEQQRQQQQGSSVMLPGESPSDELSGQTISEELSRKLNIHDPRTASQANRQPQMHSSMATGGNFDEGARCILILEHPRDIEVLPNERAVLRCTARISRRDQGRSQSKVEREDEEGEEEPNLLWYKDAEPLIGEIDCEFVVEKVTERDIGVYYCLVSHPTLEHIQRQSNVARLTIKTNQGDGVGGEPEAEANSAPEIVEQPPREVAAVINEKLLIPLEATGAQLSFRWYKDNKELRYADGPVLQIPSAHYSDSGVYCCSVSNKFGSVLSNNSLVKVTQVRDSSAQSQPGFKRPTSLYDWGDQPLSDAFLRDVGRAVANQTTNLNRIALYLGLRNQDIVEINHHFQKPEEQAFHMLRLWSRAQGRERRTLKIILTQAGIKLDLLTAGATRKPTVTYKPPKITVHPKSTRITYGHSLSLSIQVDPSEPGFALGYQWYRNGKPLGGKTDPNIVISSATNGDAGEYFCIVSNQSERTLSKVARVDVINPHASTSAPLSSMAAASSAFVHSSSAGAPHPTYLKGHWGRGSSRGGPTEPSSRCDNQCHQAPPTMGGDFLSRGGVREVEGGKADDQPSGQPLSSGVGAWDRQPGDTEATEKAGARIVPSQQQVSTAASSQQLKPQIVEHPQSQQVEAGDPLTLRCLAVGGTGQLSYMWYFNGLSLAGEDRPEYEINCFTDEDEGLYQCKVQSAHGEVLSRMAHIQMKDDTSD